MEIIDLTQGKKDQAIDGFGGTLTDSAAADLMALPLTQRDAVMNELFNPVDRSRNLNYPHCHWG